MDDLIELIEATAAKSAIVTGVHQIDKKILSAIKAVDRKHFVLPPDEPHAYEDRPLSIGHGQTISQPFIVALMLHLLELDQKDKVLEVGSGSGYVCALLSQMCSKIFGIEVIDELKEQSLKNLKSANIKNVEIYSKDGKLGLPEQAPFDKILVSAAATTLPQLLLDQLKINGIMVLPRKISTFEQMLMKVKKTSEKEYDVRDILPVRFVPLVDKDN